MRIGLAIVAGLLLLVALPVTAQDGPAVPYQAIGVYLSLLVLVGGLLMLPRGVGHLYQRHRVEAG